MPIKFFLMIFIFLIPFIVAASDAEIKPKTIIKPEVVKTLEELGDNSSVTLPDFTVQADPITIAEGWHQMNRTGPRGRDYCKKMAWMPDRKRAFFCGANHQTPHRFNDAWEFDLAANTWVLLYMPDYNDCREITDYDRNVLEIKDGWLRTKTGGGPAHPAHTWWGISYDQNKKAIFWYCAWPNYRLGKKLEAIGAKISDLYDGPPIWTYQFDGSHWQPMKTEKPWPGGPSYGGSLEYIPEWKSHLWNVTSAGSWVLDPEEKKWKSILNDKHRLPIETLTAYDSKRKILFAYRSLGKDKLEHFMFKAKIPATPDLITFISARKDTEGPMGHDARSVMYYDEINSVILLYDGTTNLVWCYDPDKNEWKNMTPQGDQSPFGKGDKIVGYFDQNLNALVIIGSKNAWCYRYQKEKTKNE